MFLTGLAYTPKLGRVVCTSGAVKTLHSSYNEMPT
jgi:hypothetical protein